MDPDFPDHWKTRMVVDALGGDEAAPVYLIRLWGHCQNRKTASFDNLPAEALKAVCRYPGSASDIERALTVAGFIGREGAVLMVVGWAEYNASLIANWTNGKKGGRPPKNHRNMTGDNPSETHGFPIDNPSSTHREPIREEKIGEEKKPPVVPRGDGAVASREAETRDRCLPDRWRNIPKGERNRVKCLRNTPLMQRIGGWFNRRPDTIWTLSEGIALFEIKPPEEDVELLESWYLASDVGDRDIRRRDLLTLLNNWTIDLDRARLWRSEIP
ncbi:hypothetical protein OKA04_15790 [Luteolibacter flavescens]|uniref:DnaT DNA-binding domain-containing protein n=1 Tax=Luteolibacter flavescens TaxID=1859460 RepID=A0ABT3FRJ2_9BACT|nr:hypothetical protein [Luteolibacter flavescens]MCW1886200.1 hypothetical protein [Luteolibacter flavescens]